MNLYFKDESGQKRDENEKKKKKIKTETIRERLIRD